MSDITFNHYPQFFTATILEWKQLLADDKMKDIIISSLQFLVNDSRVIVYGLVKVKPTHKVEGENTLRRCNFNTLQTHIGFISANGKEIARSLYTGQLTVS